MADQKGLHLNTLSEAVLPVPLTPVTWSVQQGVEDCHYVGPVLQSRLQVGPQSWDRQHLVGGKKELWIINIHRDRSSGSEGDVQEFLIVNAVVGRRVGLAGVPYRKLHCPGSWEDQSFYHTELSVTQSEMMFFLFLEFIY